MMRAVAARALSAALILVSATAFGQTPSDALDQLNVAARAAYSDGRAAQLARTGPVIVVAFDRLVLLRNGGETKETFTPPVYHQLKSIAHLPLGLVTLLLPETPGARDGAWRKRLEELRAKGEAAAASIDGLGLTAAQAQRQRHIFQDSLRFIDGVLASGAPSAAALTGFARAVGPALLANATDAARAQIDGLHAAVQRMKRAMGPEEWNRLFVVVMGAKLPRVGNLQYEYFANALGRGADRRLIYAESVFDQTRAMSLLATIVIDRKVGEAFFDDETRMERDLLADGAQEHLMRIFGRLGAN